MHNNLKCGGCGERVDTGCFSDPSACMDHETLETREGLGDFRNKFVYVREDRTTYHVDNKGNSVAASKEPLYEDNHNPVPGTLINAFAIDLLNDRLYIYGPDDATPVHFVGLTEVV